MRQLRITKKVTSKSSISVEKYLNEINKIPAKVDGSHFEAEIELIVCFEYVDVEFELAKILIKTIKATHSQIR